MPRKNIARSFMLMACLVLSPCLSYAQGTQRAINDDLMYRVSFGRVEDVRLLLDKGAETNTYGNMGDTPLVLAISRKPGEAEDIMKALLAKGADPNFPDKNGLFPLEVAIKNDRPTLAQILIDSGADIHLMTYSRVTMVDLAAHINKPDITEVMNAAMQKESEKEAKMRDPARLLPLIQNFTTDVCEMTYWNNYLMSEQNPADNANTRDKIDKAHNLGEQVGREITQYYPKVDLKSYMKYANDSISNVFASLPTLKQRSENGIGSDNDDQKRCAPIADAARKSIEQVLDAQKKADDQAKHQAELMR